jgi:hypothetical protein
MMQRSASQIAGRDVSISWVDRFIKSNSDSLLPRWTTGVDSNRHNTDSEAKYRLYFELLHEKIAKYGVEPQHTYNVDEQGFLRCVSTRGM